MKKIILILIFLVSCSPGYHVPAGYERDVIDCNSDNICSWQLVEKKRENWILCIDVPAPYKSYIFCLNGESCPDPYWLEKKFTPVDNFRTFKKCQNICRKIERAFFNSEFYSFLATFPPKCKTL